MKANELMIGDLLKWKEQPGFNDEDRNMVLCVKNIFDDAIKIDGRFELYHISLFEPISLTLETLERNGFTCDENIAKLVERDDTNNILWSAKYSFFTGMIEVVNKITGEKVKVRCYSVHELQHIFKLLEIEKKIII